jgi:nucleolar GTP-binding protein
MDLSEACGYSVAAQIALCKNLKPLFNGKPTFIVINKIDVMKPEDLDAESKAELESLLKSGDYQLLKLSCNTQEGVQEVKNAACDRLIAERVAQKLKTGTANNGGVGGRLADVLQRIHVAQPMGGVRESYIPEAVKGLKRYDKDDPNRRKLAKDVQDENGGAGVFNVSLRQDWLLKNPEWKNDKIPEARKSY